MNRTNAVSTASSFSSRNLSWAYATAAMAAKKERNEDNGGGGWELTSISATSDSVPPKNQWVWIYKSREKTG